MTVYFSFIFSSLTPTSFTNLVQILLQPFSQLYDADIQMFFFFLWRMWYLFKTINYHCWQLIVLRQVHYQL